MPIMKRLLLSTVAFTGLLAASLQAGQEVYKQVAPPPPPELYGLGFYGAIDAGANVFQNRGDDRTFSDNGIRDRFDPDADLAWQIIAGTDYYWTPKFSTFIEYKFLNYTSTQIDTREDRDLRQHLVGAGVRFHF